MFSKLQEQLDSVNAIMQEETATVEFKNVFFSYDLDKPVIWDFSLTVPSG